MDLRMIALHARTILQQDEKLREGDLLERLEFDLRDCKWKDALDVFRRLIEKYEAYEGHDE